MQTKKLLFALVFVAAFAACKQNKQTSDQPETVAGTEQGAASSVSNEHSDANPLTFDINDIAVADKFSGEFPYFYLPKGYVFTAPRSYHGKGEYKDFDKEYLRYLGTYFPMEGKTYKAVIRVDEDNFPDKKYSNLELVKSFDDLIARVGGVKINNGEKLADGELDRIMNIDPNAYTNDYLYSSNNFDDVHTYVIRTPEKTVFVQYNLGTASADITVLETKAFENKMSIMPALEIKKQIDTACKAILHINFDTDKATLKADGREAVKEIAAMLAEYNGLKLSIEGHTDNTGTSARNKELSMQRANTVKKELEDLGIDKSRLQAKGFGQEKPVSSNDTESGKAKNRRVELVKI